MERAQLLVLSWSRSSTRQAVRHRVTQRSAYLLVCRTVAFQQVAGWGNTQLTLLTAGINPELPWVMMYNGANCYSQDYHFLMNQLASKGYLAVIATEQHPSDIDLPGNYS